MVFVFFFKKAFDKTPMLDDSFTVLLWENWEIKFKVPLLKYFFGKQEVRQYQKCEFECYPNLEILLLQIH